MRLLLRLPGSQTRLAALVGLIGIALTSPAVRFLHRDTTPASTLNAGSVPGFEISVGQPDQRAVVDAYYTVYNDGLKFRVISCDEATSLGPRLAVRILSRRTTADDISITAGDSSGGGGYVLQAVPFSFQLTDDAAYVEAEIPEEMYDNGCPAVFVELESIGVQSAAGASTLVVAPRVSGCGWTSEDGRARWVEEYLEGEWWQLGCNSARGRAGPSIDVGLLYSSNDRIVWSDPSDMPRPPGGLEAPAGAQVLFENANQLRELHRDELRWSIVLGIGVSLVVESLIGLLTNLLGGRNGKPRHT